MRKMFKVLIPLFCMTFILSACSTSAPASTQTSATPTPTAKVTSTPVSTSAVATQNTKFAYGQEGVTGYWKIKILEVKEATTVKAVDSNETATANKKFIVIKVQMTNLFSSPITYAQNDFVLGNSKLDSANYMTSTSISAANILNNNESKNNNNDFISLTTTASPNILKKTYVVFEVPSNFDITYGVLWKQNGGAATTGIYFLK